MDEKTENTKSYFLGTVGAILGGLIALTATIFGYVFSEFLGVLIFSVLIGLFEFYGYKLLKGKTDKKLPIILLVTSIVLSIIASFLIIPMALLVKSNLPIGFAVIQNLYKNSKIAISIAQDFSIIIIFSILGTYLVNIIIKRKLQLEVENINLFDGNNQEKHEYKERAIKKLKPIFERYNALNCEKTITKNDILSEGDNTQYFKYLRGLGIIEKYKGKFYYEERAENNIKSYDFIRQALIAIIVAVLIASAVLMLFGLKDLNTQKISNSDVSFNIESGWIQYEDYSEEYGWIYYKANENDAQEYIGVIGISYISEASSLYTSIDDVKTMLETYIGTQLSIESYDTKILTTNKGYDALELTVDYGDYTEYDFYIYKDGKVASVTATVYNEDSSEEVEQAAQDIADSLEWLK